jgi:peptidoglycan-associated lipoprotein
MKVGGELLGVAVNYGLVVAVSAFMATGCSAGKGGLFGSGLGAKKDAAISEERLAAEPSIAQFQEMGAVTVGGDFIEIKFAFDSDAIDDAAREAIGANAELLAADANRRAEIEGHCDGRGSSEYNLALGARRARAVRDALVELGVAAERLSTVSYGEELPLCKEATEACWARNRRSRLVDLKL